MWYVAKWCPIPIYTILGPCSVTHSRTYQVTSTKFKAQGFKGDIGMYFLRNFQGLAVSTGPPEPLRLSRHLPHPPAHLCFGPPSHCRLVSQFLTLAFSNVCLPCLCVCVCIWILYPTALYTHPWQIHNWLRQEFIFLVHTHSLESHWIHCCFRCKFAFLDWPSTTPREQAWEFYFHFVLK